MPTNLIAPQRLQRLAEALEEPGLDALLISNLHNVRYLTGFTGSNATLLVSRDGTATLFTDPRYTVQAAGQVECAIRIVKGSVLKAAADKIRRMGSQRIGFEQDRVTVAQFEALKKALPQKCEAIGTSGLTEDLRMVKDPGEIELIRASVNTNSAALEAALKRLKPGTTEAQFSAEIDFQNRRLGAEAPSFDTIVAAGAGAARPHAQPGRTKIERGMLLIDMGAFREGYASDMTRMVWMGKATPRYKAAYRAVLDAQLAAIDAVKEGVAAGAVDRAARQTLKGYGFEREFVHSTGHGLGLEIHEPPRIGRKASDKLKEGMAITIEPGIYIEGWGGIRIEDTVLVTANGCEILTPTSKALREL